MKRADRTRLADRQLVKEALQDWLDTKWVEVGKWSVRGMFALAFVVAVYTMTGFKLP
jgi:hypothetical protein|tara:strand:+ start:76 stop:246 length:171 start_codon:yes stop_codon:yes gene_type:complete